MIQKRFMICLAVLCSHLLLAQSPEVSSFTKPFDGNGSIAISQDGTIYVNEYGLANPDISGSGTRIFKLDSNGEVTVVRDDVSGAVGNVFDSKGNYFFNHGNSLNKSMLMKMSTDGKLEKIVEVKGFSGDLLLSKDEKSILIPSYTHPVIRQVSLDGEVVELLSDERLKGCTGLVYGENGMLIASNFSSGSIYLIDSEKEIREIAKIPTPYPGYAVGYITYFEDYIYATGYGSNKIYRVSAKSGEVEEFAGNGERTAIDGSGDEASFITPNGIEIDSKNRRLLISQNGNGKPASLRAIKLD